MALPHKGQRKYGFLFSARRHYALLGGINSTAIAHSLFCWGRRSTKCFALIQRPSVLGWPSSSLRHDQRTWNIPPHPQIFHESCFDWDFVFRSWDVGLAGRDSIGSCLDASSSVLQLQGKQVAKSSAFASLPVLPEQRRGTRTCRLASAVRGYQVRISGGSTPSRWHRSRAASWSGSLEMATQRSS
jgi:hypothetical protein